MNDNKPYLEDLRAEFTMEEDMDWKLFLEFLQKRLTPNEASLIFRIIERGESFTEIGKHFGVTRQAISMRMAKLIKKLKALREEFNA